MTDILSGLLAGVNVSLAMVVVVGACGVGVVLSHPRMAVEVGTWLVARGRGQAAGRVKAIQEAQEVRKEMEEHANRVNFLETELKGLDDAAAAARIRAIRLLESVQSGRRAGGRD